LAAQDKGLELDGESLLADISRSDMEAAEI
jgi:hypothetical protein